MLYANCSEYVDKIKVREEEIPYIKRRVREIENNEDGQEDLMDEFLNQEKDEESCFMSDGIDVPYKKIRDELIFKRGDGGIDICPLCQRPSNEER